jgi:hypothetical protein
MMLMMSKLKNRTGTCAVDRGTLLKIDELFNKVRTSDVKCILSQWFGNHPG